MSGNRRSSSIRVDSSPCPVDPPFLRLPPSPSSLSLQLCSMEVEARVTAFERSEIVLAAYEKAEDLKIFIASPRVRAKSIWVIFIMGILCCINSFLNCCKVARYQVTVHHWF
jgi:hypothetical protein